VVSVGDQLVSAERRRVTQLGRDEQARAAEQLQTGLGSRGHDGRRRSQQLARTLHFTLATLFLTHLYNIQMDPRDALASSSRQDLGVVGQWE